MSNNQIDFDYTGYEVVHKEYFSHIYDPSITFYKNRVNINSACLKCLPNITSIQMLINISLKTLVLKPCKPNSRDSLVWCSGKGSQRKPRYISCKILSGMLFDFMKWNEKYKYKIIGNVINTEQETILLFNLDSAEAFENNNTSNPGSLPNNWKNHFGIELKTHNDIRAPLKTTSK